MTRTEAIKWLRTRGVATEVRKINTPYLWMCWSTAYIIPPGWQYVVSYDGWDCLEPM